VSPQRFFESKKRIQNIRIGDFQIDSKKHYFCDVSPIAVKDLKKKLPRHNEYGIQDWSCKKPRNCKSVDRDSRKAFEKLVSLDRVLCKNSEDVKNDENLNEIKNISGKLKVRTKKILKSLSSTPKPVYKARSFSRLKSIH
jgi:hypothetical protein